MVEVPNLVLIHGAWHHGGTWAATAGYLRNMGWRRVYTPTIAGHGPGADIKATFPQMVQSVVDQVNDDGLDDIVFVAHSAGGTILSQIIPQIGVNRIRRAVFFDAYVLEDGHSMFDESPPELAALMRSLADADNAVTLPYPFWRELMIQDATESVAKSAYAQLYREPLTLPEAKLDQKAFFEIVAANTLPFSYINTLSDIVGGIGEQWNWFPRFPARLPAARVQRYPGTHEVMFTHPELMARYIIEAARD